MIPPAAENTRHRLQTGATRMTRMIGRVGPDVDRLQP